MIDTTIPKAPFPMLGEDAYTAVLRDAIQTLEANEEAKAAELTEWAQRRVEFYALRGAT